MILNESELKIYRELDNKITTKEWFTIGLARKDRDNIINAIKVRILNEGDFEFNNDSFTKFRRIEKWTDFYKNLDNPRGISIKTEWYKEQDVVFDYSHLPEPIFTDPNKKVKRRAV